ncbi:EAL domain-containing protein [Sphingomonas sp. CJ99]
MSGTAPLRPSYQRPAGTVPAAPLELAKSIRASEGARIAALPTDRSQAMLILVRIANFDVLRRHLGIAASFTLVDRIADHLHHGLPNARITISGRRTLELTLSLDADEQAEQVLADARALFSEPLILEGERHRIGITLGAAIGNPRHDPIRLIELAEAALRQAQSDERDIVRTLGESDDGLDPMALIRDLPGAIANGQMVLHYQPKVHVRRQEVASVEALVRWRHPVHGLILPGDFITLAEQADQIGPLTLWTLAQAIEDQGDLASVDHDIPIFVNISGLLLADAEFVRLASEMVSASNGRIGFEITETSVIRDPQVAIRHLKLFADAGIPIAIDDYGAGLSSLAYLKQLPASELKIDKLFVTQLTSSNRDPLIVRSTIDLAHALDMEVVAEGVETPAAMALLSVMGCDLIQGYLISRPIEIDALKDYLGQHRYREALTRPTFSFHRGDRFWKQVGQAV